jgi:hypothetical protein
MSLVRVTFLLATKPRRKEKELPMRFLYITNGSFLLLAIFAILSSSAKWCLAAEPPAADIVYDVLILGGMVYDGSGKAPKRADVGVKGDRIAVVGNLANATAKNVVDAKDLAVAPPKSWAKVIRGARSMMPSRNA